MTVDGRWLLRMLEPAVRPNGAGQAMPPSRLPVEQQSFEQLLSQRMTGHEAAAGDGLSSQRDERQEQMGNGAGPLGPLAGVDLVENVSLRQLMAEQREQQQLG